jgi:hypothetical protein
MSLVILTKSPGFGLCSKEAWLSAFRRLFGIRRGPDAVSASLLRGLNEMKYSYRLNPPAKEIGKGDAVFVNNSIGALKWAIQQKKSGAFKKLIVGPNLVVTPDDFDGIINSPEIDLILQPAEWVRNLYLSISPSLSDKIKVWPAGVSVPENINENSRRGALVYFKNCSDNKLLENILNELKARSIETDVITYGHYKQKDYFALLEKVKFTIFISKSESQGLAMQEAWARNVPTFVWNGGTWNYRDHTWRDSAISAPYLNERSGLFFSSFEDFKTKLEKNVGDLSGFSPREYVRENLSDLKCAEKFIAFLLSD